MEHKIKQYTSLMLLALFAVFLIYGLIGFLTSFLGALVFYVIFKNIMFFLVQKKKWNKNLSAFLVMLTSFLIMILPAFFLIQMLYTKVQGILQNPDQMYVLLDQLMLYAKEIPISLTSREIVDKAIAWGTPLIGGFFSGALGLLGNVIMMYFFLYFLLINTRRVEAQLILLLPFEREKIELFGKELVGQTYSNALGIPLIAIVQGLCSFVCFYLCEVPDAGFWAVLLSFSSFIPFVGTFLVWGPVVIYLFSIHANMQGWVVLVFSVLVLTNLDNIIRMFLSKKMGDVHPLVTVLGVVLGLNYFGIPGLVFGPLIISYFLLFVRLYYQNYLSKT